MSGFDLVRAGLVGAGERLEVGGLGETVVAGGAGAWTVTSWLVVVLTPRSSVAMSVTV